MASNHLQHYAAVLSIGGADANSFLQGQFTGDLRGENGLARYGLWLDHKGKVQADGFVLRRGAEDFLVVSYRSPGGAIKAHLERYIVADEVDVRDVTGDWSGFATWGGDCGEVLARLGVSAPEAGQFGISGSTICFRGRRTTGPGFEVLVPRDKEPAIRASVPEFVSEEQAEAERIRSVLAAVPDDIGEGDLPQEGGLDSAICYTKGCFTGQEVMARLKNLGKVRRQLLPVRGTGGVPARGTELFQNGKRVGETRSSVRNGDGFLAMAMLTLMHLDPDAPLSTAAGATGDIAVLKDE